MSGLSVLTNVAAYGLGAISVAPQRGFYSQDGSFNPISAQAVFQETHRDSQQITDHPVEQGTQISDHAFMYPSEVTIRCGWSNSPSNAGLLNALLGTAAAYGNSTVRTLIGAGVTASAVYSLLTGNSVDQVRSMYQQLLTLMMTRTLFTVYTGKRVYQNMLVKELHTETDKFSENSGYFTVVCRQIILVNTTTVTAVPNKAGAQAAPQETAPTTDAGTKQLKPSTATPTVGAGASGTF